MRPAACSATRSVVIKAGLSWTEVKLLGMKVEVRGGLPIGEP